MTSSSNPTPGTEPGVAFSSAASAPSGMNIAKLEEFLSQSGMDFEDLASALELLVMVYTPTAAEADAYYRTLEEYLTRFDLDLGWDTEECVRFYALLATLYERHPVLITADDGFGRDLEDAIDYNALSAIAKMDLEDESSIFAIINSWEKIAKIHIAHRVPVQGFCENLARVLQGDFFSSVPLKNAMKSLEISIQGSLAARSNGNSCEPPSPPA